MRTAQQGPGSVSMISFGRFISARAAGQIACAREIAERYSQQYSPVTDPYAPFVAAVRRGLDTGCHELEIQRALSNASDKRRGVLIGLKEPYLRLLSRSPGTYTPAGRAIWQTPDLDVTVTPEFSRVTPAGEIEVIKLYLRVDPLTRDAADGMLFVMSETMDELCPGGKPVLWDLRRERVFTPRSRRREFGSWLRLQASNLAALWRAVA